MAKTNQPPYLNEDGSVLTSDPKFHAWKHPRYLEAWNRCNELKTKLVLINKDISAENSRIHTERSRNRHMEHAEALAYGTERPAGSAAADLAKLNDEGRILTTAIQIAEKRVGEVESEVSAEICKQARDAYVRMGKAIIPILRELDKVTSLEKRFIAEMIDGGTRIGNLPPVARVPFDPGRTADFILKEALEVYDVDLVKGE